MNIRLLRNLSDKKFEVKSQFGDFVGEWAGNDKVNSGDFEVELTVDDISKYKLSAELTSIQSVGSKTIINGLVEDEDEDGVRYLRLGKDLVLIDLEGESLKGKYIELESGTIRIFPI